MIRLRILLTVMVVMVGAVFAAHEAVAKVLIVSGGDDTLVGTARGDRLTGRAGEDYLKGSRGADRLWGSRGDDRIWGSSGSDKIVPGEGNDTVYAGYGDDLIYARDTDGVDFIDCGGEFDEVETIHRDDKTKGNCERALGSSQGDI